jgi:hypothetical protein
MRALVMSFAVLIPSRKMIHLIFDRLVASPGRWADNCGVSAEEVRPRWSVVIVSELLPVNPWNKPAVRCRWCSSWDCSISL